MLLFATTARRCQAHSVGQPQNYLLTVQYSFTRCKSVLSPGFQKYFVVNTKVNRKWFVLHRIWFPMYFYRKHIRSNSRWCICNANPNCKGNTNAPGLVACIIALRTDADANSFCWYSFPQTDIAIEYRYLVNIQGIQLGMAFDKQLGIHPVVFLHIWYHFVANPGCLDNF